MARNMLEQVESSCSGYFHNSLRETGEKTKFFSTNSSPEERVRFSLALNLWKRKTPKRKLQGLDAEFGRERGVYIPLLARASPRGMSQNRIRAMKRSAGDETLAIGLYIIKIK